MPDRIRRDTQDKKTPCLSAIRQKTVNSVPNWKKNFSALTVHGHFTARPLRRLPMVFSTIAIDARIPKTSGSTNSLLAVAVL
jgi:hypothetical protein